MKLIKLNYFTGNDSEWVEEIYINEDTIISIRPREWYSEIETTLCGQLKVEETVEEIQSQLDGKKHITYSIQRRIGKNIKEIRRITGMSLFDFGKTFGVDTLLVMEWETGRNRPNAEILHQIVELSDFVGVPIRELLED